MGERCNKNKLKENKTKEKNITCTCSSGALTSGKVSFACFSIADNVLRTIACVKNTSI